MQDKIVINDYTENDPLSGDMIKERRNNIMDRLTYIMSNHSKKFLLDNGFRFNRNLSDSTEEIYTYRFPVVSYKKSTVIECEISVSVNTGITTVSVINTSTKDLYCAYYNREYGRSEVVKSIDTHVNKKLKGLGINYEDDNNSRMFTM